MKTPDAWAPLEGDVVVTALTTSESAAIDLGADCAGRPFIFSCHSGEWLISFGTTATITTAKASHNGQYRYVAANGARYFKAKMVSGTGNLSHWPEKGD